MSDGQRRGLIPQQYKNLDLWPDISVVTFTDEERARILREKEAIVMYLSGESFEIIEREKGVKYDELRRKIRRCLTPASDGSIFGFRALRKHFRIEPYHRQKDVKGKPLSALDRSSGFAGALGQLFERFPELESFVVHEFLGEKHGNRYVEAPRKVVDIHADFIEFLKKALKLDEWPLNTKTKDMPPSVIT
ncbi:hypothetical protein AWV79_02425 [Cupriavidus sp. UYMMa02A]|nr:hypothetical protein AWV79_02425 [Cupriavidus sp. UYMMa02A]